MLIVFGTIYPVTNVLPHIITISVITVSFSFVGIQFIEYRQNKFFRTNKSISMPNSIFLLGTFITLLAILLLASFTLTTITWFLSVPFTVLQQTVDNVYFDEIDPIRQFLSGKSFFSNFSVSNINFLKFTYALLISVVMTSLLAILVGTMFKSVKSYTVLTLTYLILYVVLGGLAIPKNIIEKSYALSFLAELIPNTHTNNLLSASMNEGHIENAYNYIYYTEAVELWTENIVQLYNSGALSVTGPLTLSPPDGYTGTQMEWIAELKDIMNSQLELIGRPEVSDEWIDPLTSNVVAAAWPWINAFLQTFGDFLFNLNIEPNSVSVIRIWYCASLIADNATDFDEHMKGFIDIVVVVNTNYSAIGDSLRIMIHPDPFTFKTTYGIISNVVPLALIILTLPNFIVIGREE